MLCNIKPVPITNLITTFLPKFQGGSGPPVPPSGSALDLILASKKLAKKFKSKMYLDLIYYKDIVYAMYGAFSCYFIN